MLTDNNHFRLSLLHPRYLTTWVLMGFWWLVIQFLPFYLQLWCGKWLGRLFLQMNIGRRRQIAARNLELCFPEMEESKRLKLLRLNFESMGITVFETGIAWFWPRWRLRRLFTIEGLHHLEADKNKGKLLMAVHFTTLEIGAAFIGMHCAVNGMYRRHKNPVFDYVQRKGREQHHPGTSAIPRQDVREVLNTLRQKRIVWYAPDQDYGPKQSVFAPFFGVEAATVTATAKFSRYGKALVIPFTQTRIGHHGYHVTIHPPLENFPCGDEKADACTVNGLVETVVLEQPEQYLWCHRRFKTRPAGEADLYNLPKRKRKIRARSLFQALQLRVYHAE